jgi:heat shock protein HslJ
LSSDRTLREQELSSTLSFSKVFSTMLACIDQSVNDREAAFNQAMSSVASFEISNGQLSLKDAGGATVLVFTKA